MVNSEFVFSYTYTNPECLEKVRDALHNYLCGYAHKDYVDNHIVLSEHKGNVTVHIWPYKCKHGVPYIFKKWNNFVKFCRDIENSKGE